MSAIMRDVANKGGKESSAAIASAAAVSLPPCRCRRVAVAHDERSFGGRAKLERHLATSARGVRAAAARA
jgi:hypothetical protein